MKSNISSTFDNYPKGSRFMYTNTQIDDIFITYKPPSTVHTDTKYWLSIPCEISLFSTFTHITISSSIRIRTLIYIYTLHTCARARAFTHIILDFLFYLFVHSFYRLEKKTFFCLLLDWLDKTCISVYRE